MEHFLFFSETLRKYPAVAFINRKCVADYKIPNTDIELKKGIDLTIPIKGLHYDEQIYENPEKFDPDRFSPENNKKRHQYAYMPFGGGPRICIGKCFFYIPNYIIGVVLYCLTLNDCDFTCYL